VHDEDDDRIHASDPYGAAELKKRNLLVSPEEPEWRIVQVMSRMSMSRDEKAVYLARAGFKPQAISAILAQVDRYTEENEG